MELSNIVVQKIIAINTINIPTGIHHVKNRPQCELCYKRNGRTVFSYDGCDYISDSNHIVYVPQGASYTFNVLEIGECRTIEFDAANVGSKFYSVNISNGAEILSIIDQMAHTKTFNEHNYDLFCLSGLYRILYSLTTQYEPSPIQRGNINRIAAGIDYIEQNYTDESLSIKKAAEICNISESYFRKLFTEVYGMPPKKYINLLRLNKAKELLATAEIQIQDIAVATGFHDVYNFCKVFSKVNGCTPSEYRKNLQK